MDARRFTLPATALALAAGLALAAPLAGAARPSVEQYGGSGGVSGDVAQGLAKPGEDGARKCIEQVLADNEGAPAQVIADRILEQCDEAVADPAEQVQGSGLPVTGLDIVFLVVGVLVLILIGWLISRLVLHETEPGR